MSLAATEADMGKQGKCSRCGTVFMIEIPRAALSAPVTTLSAPPATDPYATPGVIRAGEGISRGFAVLHSNVGTFVLMMVCLAGLGLGLGLVGIIPCIGIFVSLATAFVVGPALNAGFYRACLKQHDGGQADVSDLFAEFSLWVDFVLLLLVQIAIGIVICIPGLILLLISLVPLMQGQKEPNIPVLAVAVLVTILCGLVWRLSLIFVMPALVDRRRGFWDAIQTSWGLMISNPFGSLGAVLMAGLLGFLGMLMCCVGWVYTGPAIFCMFASIYRTGVPFRAQPPAPMAGSPAAWPQQPPPPPTGLAAVPPPPLGGNSI